MVQLLGRKGTCRPRRGIANRMRFVQGWRAGAALHGETHAGAGALEIIAGVHCWSPLLIDMFLLFLTLIGTSVSLGMPAGGLSDLYVPTTPDFMSLTCSCSGLYKGYCRRGRAQRLLPGGYPGW